MADKNTRRLSPSDLQADLDSYAGLESLKDYAPANAAFAMANGTAAKSVMQASQVKEVQDNALAMASHDKSKSDEWAFHDFIRNARIQVKAQYGESSDELQTVGLKKKSEYKSPKKKAPTP